MWNSYFSSKSLQKPLIFNHSQCFLYPWFKKAQLICPSKELFREGVEIISWRYAAECRARMIGFPRNAGPWRNVIIYHREEGISSFRGRPHSSCRGRPSCTTARLQWSRYARLRYCTCLHVEWFDTQRMYLYIVYCFVVPERVGIGARRQRILFTRVERNWGISYFMT